MASFSSPSNIYTDTPNSTFMTASYPPPEADYTIYCKEALILCEFLLLLIYTVNVQSSPS